MKSRVYLHTVCSVFGTLPFMLALLITAFEIPVIELTGGLDVAAMTSRKIYHRSAYIIQTRSRCHRFVISERWSVCFSQMREVQMIKSMPCEKSCEKQKKGQTEQGKTAREQAQTARGQVQTARKQRQTSTSREQGQTARGQVQTAREQRQTAREQGLTSRKKLST